MPDVLGRTLAQAEGVLRTGGLQGSADERDPQGRTAVVVAQEPPAGVVAAPPARAHGSVRLGTASVGVENGGVVTVPL